MANKRRTEHKDEEYDFDDGDEVIDLNADLDTIFELTQPAEEYCEVETVGRKMLPVKYRVMGQAAGMQALNGLKRMKDNDKIRSERDIGVFVKRVNPALTEIQFRDDRGAILPPKRDADGKIVFSVDILTVRGWNKLLECIFPGTYQTPEDIQTGADAGRRRLVRGVPVSGNADASDPVL